MVERINLMGYSKIKITGVIESVSGMHIGGVDRFSAIGSIDSYVARDVITDYPMIPGSSLKGKMRSLLAKQYNEKPSDFEHDDLRIIRLFGSAKGDNKNGRLIFSDMFVLPERVEELKNKKVPLTEVKAENTINRLTSVANPRFIERSVRGVQYGFELIYTIEAKDSEEDVISDINVIKNGIKLLELDYIGGSGSRGYGKIKFLDIDANCVYGNCSDALISQIKDVLKDE